MGFIRVISGDLVLTQCFIYNVSVFFPIAIVNSFYLKNKCYTFPFSYQWMTILLRFFLLQIMLQCSLFIVSSVVLVKSVPVMNTLTNNLGRKGFILDCTL